VSNWRTERCECRREIPVGEGVVDAVVGQTVVYLCKPCAVRKLNETKATGDAYRGDRIQRNGIWMYWVPTVGRYVTIPED
jgi:hypothetical protein